MTISPLNKTTRIYIAGHRGMVGSAILRHLQSAGHKNIITRTHAELDLTEQQPVRDFFQTEKIDYIVLAAAKVGGIHANNTYRADFIYQNLMVQNNVIHEAYKAGIERILFLGSSCIYPRHAPQPMKEEYLLTGLMEPTNEPYAVAKIAGIKICESYNRQYGTHYRSVMPTNLYGPNDNYHLEDSHLMPALIRKFHLARLATDGDWDGIEKDQSRYGKIPTDVMSNLRAIAESAGHSVPESLRASLPSEGCLPAADAIPSVLLWGTGTPHREFLHVDDMADACVHVMSLPDDQYASGLLNAEIGDPSPTFYNVGMGKDHTIAEYAETVSRIVGFEGEISFDPEKPDGMPRKLLDISRLKHLGWTPRISLEAGIQQTYEEYLC